MISKKFFVINAVKFSEHNAKNSPKNSFTVTENSNCDIKLERFERVLTKLLANYEVKQILI